jgi:hypothetical protein
MLVEMAANSAWHEQECTPELTVHASALAFISLLFAARTIIFRFITKDLVRFAFVALIAVNVQVSLISLPSAQTTSAEKNARELLGSSPSESVEQIEGTYEGTFTINQVAGEHQISLTFKQSGSEIRVTYRSALGGRGSGNSTLLEKSLRPCPYEASQIVRDYSRLRLSFPMIR